MKALKAQWNTSKNTIKNKSGLGGEDAPVTAFPFFAQCHALFYEGQDREHGLIETGISGKLY